MKLLNKKSSRKNILVAQIHIDRYLGWTLARAFAFPSGVNFLVRAIKILRVYIDFKLLSLVRKVFCTSVGPTAVHSGHLRLLIGG